MLNIISVMDSVITKKAVVDLSNVGCADAATEGSSVPGSLFPDPFIVFLGFADDVVLAKTALGLRDWAPERCLAQLRLSAQAIDLGIPDLTIQQARAQGLRSLVIGVAPSGGAIPTEWRATLIEAAKAGLTIVSGLHEPLEAVEGLAQAAQASGVGLVNIRQPPSDLPIGTGRKRSGLRVLSVGGDCAVGKKYAALSIAGALRKQGIEADFRATGQTGIIIAGTGVPVDAVKADFLSGAIEWLTPDAAPAHWDVIEGQGSLFHPSYAGVALGVLHGAQPDALIYCHPWDRADIDGCPGFPIPSLEEGMARNLEAARLTNPRCEVVAVALNTSRLSDDEACALAEETGQKAGVVAFDPLRFGVAEVAQKLVQMTARNRDI